MSKFDFDIFYNSIDDLAVSKEKYTKEQAIEIAEREFGGINVKYLAVGNAFVRYRYGVADGEKHSCWWLEYIEHKRSCPCWVFHLTNNSNEWCNKEYEYRKLREEKGK